jgi:hypothetical protein
MGDCDRGLWLGILWGPMMRIGNSMGDMMGGKGVKTGDSEGGQVWRGHGAVEGVFDGGTMKEGL